MLVYVGVSFTDDSSHNRCKIGWPLCRRLRLALAERARTLVYSLDLWSGALRKRGK